MSLTARVALVAALTASNAAACSPTVTTPWVLPDWPGAAAFLLQFRTDTTAQLLAFDRDEAPNPLPFAPNADGLVEATVLALARPLSDHAVAPGVQTLVPRSQGRAWPPLLGIAGRRLDDDDWRLGLRLEDLPLGAWALDAAPLCPPAVAEPWPLRLTNPADLVALDASRALLATDAALWVITAPRWALEPQPLPNAEALKAIWVDADGAIVAGAAQTSRLHVGRWDGNSIRWNEQAELASPAGLVAITGARGGPAYGVTSEGELVRVRTGPARVERMFKFRATTLNTGAGVALRGREALVAYSNVEAGLLVFFDGAQSRTESVFPGPLNLMVSVDALGVVAGSALGFSVLRSDSGAFSPLGSAPLDPQALVGTRDGFIAFATNGDVLRYDRRSAFACPPQPIAAGEFRAAVALDAETVLALEQNEQPGEPMTAWHLRIPPLPF